MNLQLSLKKHWFEMTKAGIKTEDYRDLTLYWFKRIVFNSKKLIEQFNIKTDDDVYNFCSDEEHLKWLKHKGFITNTMTLGYPKKDDISKIVVYKNNGIKIKKGNTEWGAEPNKLYFVIKHGDIYST